MDRIIAWHAQNPESHLENRGLRYTRVGFGTWLRDALGSALGNGVFTNIAVEPSGLYVFTQPGGSNAPAAVYQLQAEDPTAIPPSSADQLAADPTLVVLQGLQSSPSANLGPVTVPGAGLSVYYLVEAQVAITDGVPETLTFVSTSGARSTATEPTARQDLIAYQLKAGTPSSSPSIPAPDAGWIPIATVLVPNGASVITSGMIALYPSFNGFQTAAVVAPVRTTIVATATAVSAGGTVNISPAMAKSYLLMSVTTDVAARVRIYKNAAELAADASRPPSTSPTPGDGLVFEGVNISSALSIDCSPQPVGSNTESTPTTAIPIAVTNNTGSTTDVHVTLTYLPLE